MHAVPDAEPAPQDDPGAPTSPNPDTGPAGSAPGRLAGPDSTLENEPEVAETSAPSATPLRRTRRYPDDVSDDDGDVGWGDRPGRSERGDSWYLSERPPHHG